MLTLALPIVFSVLVLLDLMCAGSRDALLLWLFDMWVFKLDRHENICKDKIKTVQHWKLKNINNISHSISGSVFQLLLAFVKCYGPDPCTQPAINSRSSSTFVGSSYDLTAPHTKETVAQLVYCVLQPCISLDVKNCTDVPVWWHMLLSKNQVINNFFCHKRH